MPQKKRKSFFVNLLSEHVELVSQHVELKSQHVDLVSQHVGNSQIGRCTTLGRNSFNVKTLLGT